MNIIVTGSNGFVGSKLMRVLDQAGHNLKGIDISPDSDDKVHPATIIGDIRNIEDLNRVYDSFKQTYKIDPDLIIHCAAAKHDFGITQRQYFSHNRDGTAVLIDFMGKKKIYKLINISSVSVFGHPLQATDENGEYNPNHPYGESKLAAEKLCINWQQKDKNRELIVLRPAVIYGTHNYANVYKLMDLMHRKPYLKIGSSNHIKAIVSRTTTVDMIVFSLKILKPGFQHFNCVDKPYITLSQLIKIIARNPKFKIPPISIPFFMALIVGYVFDIPAKIFRLDIPVNSDRMRKLATPTYFTAEKIREAGFIQRNTIEESVDEMTKWYLDLQGDH